MVKVLYGLGLPSLSCVLFVSSCGGADPPSGGNPPLLTENTAVMCRDGKDNDDDGFTDCDDQDCWPLLACHGLAPDGWRTPDGGTGDGPLDGYAPRTDATSFDTGLQHCATHCDCQQEWFCYKGRCIRDPKVAVYCCSNPGCPPGHWCVTPGGTKDRCDEDPGHVCQDACDCGPAHCCVDVPSLGGKRCVKNTADPWLQGGSLLDPSVTCSETDATYCCEEASCYAGKAAFARTALPFVCHGSAGERDHCGGDSCYGTACRCAAGESCVDTVEDSPAGKTCGLLSGGSCVSNATAEAVFSWKADDLLPCCSSAGPAGVLCDAGWRTDNEYAYARVVATRGGSCGDGSCDPGETVDGCPADCTPVCGDGTCEPSEQAGCEADCGGQCDNGTCELWETPRSCPADCADRCAASTQDTWILRVCGDGVCGGARACEEPETCRTCPQDCGACTNNWQVISRAEVWPDSIELSKMWAESDTSIFVIAELSYSTSILLHHDGSRWRGLATTGSLAAIWGASSSSVFAVGDDGLIVRYDGKSVVTMTSGTTEDLVAVWGSSPTDVYAAGAQGTLLRFDGTAWAPVSLPVAEDLTGLWGSSASDIYLTGKSEQECVYQSCPAGCSQEDCLCWAQCWGGWGMPTTCDCLEKCAPTTVCGDTPASLLLHYDGTTWTPVAGLPQDAVGTLNAVWGDSSGRVFAVGVAGLIVGFDGTQWSKMDAGGLTDSLVAIWGSSATDVYAVGDDSLVHYDGASWTKLSSAWDITTDLVDVDGASSSDVFVVADTRLLRKTPGGWKDLVALEASTLRDAWGSSPTDILAVGSGSDREHMVLRFDGAGWSWQPLSVAGAIWGLISLAPGPAPGQTLFALDETGSIVTFDGTEWDNHTHAPSVREYQGLWVTPQGELLVAGGTSGAPSIQRYDGQAWQPELAETTDESSFGCVGGPSSQTAFLLGGTSGGFQLDAAGWTRLGLPALGVCDTATAAGHVFVVGEGGAILHYDGSGWSTMASPTNEDLTAVWAASAVEVFAAGAQGTLLHRGGGGWSQVATQTSRLLTGIWGSSTSDVYVTTDAGSQTGEYVCPAGCTSAECDCWTSCSPYLGCSCDPACLRTMVYPPLEPAQLLHYDGKAVSAVSLPADVVGSLYAVWGSGATDVYVAGGGRDAQTGVNFRTLLHYDGTQWSEVPTGKTTALVDLWGSSSSDIYAADATSVLRFDGASWTQLSLSVSSIKQLWGTSASNVHVLGSKWLRFDGASWTELRPPTYGRLHDIWGASASDIFAAGEGGTIFHYDGKDWTSLAALTGESLRAIAGTGPGHVLFVGDEGTVLRYDGTQLVAMTSGSSASLRGVWVASTGEAVAVGNHCPPSTTGGLTCRPEILRFDGTSWQAERRDWRRESPFGFTCPTVHAAWGAGAQDVHAFGWPDLVVRYCPGGSCPQTPTAPNDAGVTPDAGAPDAAVAICGNGTCDVGESCDGRSATVACSQDCPGGFLNNPNKEYCFVNGVCVGPGCA